MWLNLSVQHSIAEALVTMVMVLLLRPKGIIWIWLVELTSTGISTPISHPLNYRCAPFVLKTNEKNQLLWKKWFAVCLHQRHVSLRWVSERESEWQKGLPAIEILQNSAESDNYELFQTAVSFKIKSDYKCDNRTTCKKSNHFKQS